MKQVVLGTARGQIVTCGVADGFWSRLVGLMGRRGLGAGDGLLLSPCGTVHTGFMRFECDVVFLARDGEVLRVARRTPPWRLRRAPRRTRLVLELAAGEAARVGLEPGTCAEPRDEIGRRLIAREARA